MGMFKLLYFIMRSPENYNMLQIALMVILTPGHLFYKLFSSWLALIALKDSV